MWTKKETALTACLQMSIAGLHSVICISLLLIKEARLLANRIKDPGKNNLIHSEKPNAKYI